VTGEVRAIVARNLLVENHADFKDLVRSLLGQEPHLEVVAKAASLVEARQDASRCRFEMALLYLGLPDDNGTDLIEDRVWPTPA
jgi:DNA-binding NarL/FixJ family response regulator